MSLGQPNLYVAGALVAGGTTTTVTTLAGVTINWGNDSRVDFAGPATLTAEVLVKSGAVPAWANGTQVGLTDPISGRCLFAGHISNLTGGPDESIKSAFRIRFTATSPLADLKNHVVAVDWQGGTQISRFVALQNSIARGWIMNGYEGHLYEWIGAGRLRFKEHNWLELAELWCRSVVGRYHDTSSYTPGAGFTKRLTMTFDRGKTAPIPPAPGATGVWNTGGSKPEWATGIAALPASAIGRDIEWEKNPEDTVTDVRLGTYGIAILDEGEDSSRFAYWMEAHGVNNQALQDAYGFRQLSLDTDISSSNTTALTSWIQSLTGFWLDADTKWRPTAVEIPDAGKLDTAPMLNLLAVDTRHMAALYVPAGPGINPGKIHAYVTKGRATWTGKKWTATLTLGRTFD